MPPPRLPSSFHRVSSVRPFFLMVCSGHAQSVVRPCGAQSLLILAPQCIEFVLPVVGIHVFLIVRSWRHARRTSVLASPSICHASVRCTPQALPTSPIYPLYDD